MPLAGELVLIVARLLAGCWLLWRLAGARGFAPRRAGCAVIVPARDEAASLPTLLGSLEGQLARSDELVVVDDHSLDSTAEVATAGGAHVVAGRPLPPGWTGKTWACWQGAYATRAPVLVFLDADVAMEPGGIGHVLSARAACGGLVSVQPYHRVPRPYERLSAFFNVLALMGTGAFSPRRGRRPPTGAYGPVLVMSREDYFAAGGHRAVAGEVLDDVALAGRTTAAGLPVTCFAGKGTARFRMYPAGLRSLVEGWTKNFVSGARAIRPLTLAVIVAWLTVVLQSAWWGMRLTWTDPDPGEVQAAAALYGVVALQLWWMLRRAGSFGPVTALLFPVPLAFFLAVFLRAGVFAVFRRPVRWKGRTVPAGQAGDRRVGSPTGRKTRSRK